MFRAPQGKWKTKDERVILITKMDDEHLENAIKLIQRNLDRGHYDFHTFIYETRVEVGYWDDSYTFPLVERPASTKEAEEKLEELLSERNKRAV